MLHVVSHPHLAAGVLHSQTHISRTGLSVFEIPALTSGRFAHGGPAELQMGSAMGWPRCGCCWRAALGAEVSVRTVQLLGTHASHSRARAPPPSRLNTALTFVLPFDICDF